MSEKNLTAAAIFKKLSDKFNQPILTEEVSDTMGHYILHKFFIIKDVDVLSQENLQKIEEVNRLLSRKIDSLSFEICCFILERHQLKIRKFKEVCFPYNGDQVRNPFKNYPDIEARETTYLFRKPVFAIDIGDDGEAWIHNVSREYKKEPGSSGDKKHVKAWPATITDITKAMQMYDDVSEVVKALIEVWSEKSFGWREVYTDLKECPVYLPIPVKTVFDSQSKFELMYKVYGNAEKSAWTEHIGDSVFYERSKMLVSEENMPLLKTFKPTEEYKNRQDAKFKISNKKQDLFYPLALFMFNRIKKEDSDSYNGHRLSIGLIEESILYTSQMREKVPVDLSTAKSVWTWCTIQRIRYYGKSYPLVKIPKNYCFKNLKITNGTMLKTRKKLVNEEISQCYEFLSIFSNLFSNSFTISEINKGTLSVWSIERNGKHYTAIISTNKNKRKFTIKEIIGYEGKVCENDVYMDIKKEIESQTPFRNPRKKAS